MLGAYVAALLAALFTMGVFIDLPQWQSILLADVVGTIVIFGFSVVLNNSSMYDPYWSVAPIFIALYLLWQPDVPDVSMARKLIVTALVIVWGARLTFNFFRGWPGLAHEDWRYVDLREQNGKAYWLVSFAGIHMFPTVLVFLGCLALFPAINEPNNTFNVLDVLAIIVTATAIWLEATADKQLHNFVKSKPTPGTILKTGLWSHSRHPNYLGEILFWWGLFLFAMAARPDHWWVIVGPLSITLLFNFISVPMIDKRSLKRRQGYAEHMQEVPKLLPKFKRESA